MILQYINYYICVNPNVFFLKGKRLFAGTAEVFAVAHQTISQAEGIFVGADIPGTSSDVIVDVVSEVGNQIGSGINSVGA